jgi:hypothetical protein
MKNNIIFFVFLVVFGLFSACEKKAASKTSQNLSVREADGKIETPKSMTAAESDKILKQSGGQVPGTNAAPVTLTKEEIEEKLRAEGKTKFEVPNISNEPSAKIAVPTAQKKALSASKMAFMTEQNFLVTLAAGSKPSDFTNFYENRWLIFNKDMTFSILKNDQAESTGKWAYDEAGDELFLRTDNKFFNNSWKCQNFKKNLLLLGNTELNHTGIQIRLYMTTEKPGTINSDGSKRE